MSELATAVSPRRRRHPASPRWERWQQTPTSERLLSLQARQDGYTVLRPSVPLRETFLDIAKVFTLYERRIQTPQVTPSRALLELFRVWAEDTHALIVALDGTAHD